MPPSSKKGPKDIIYRSWLLLVMRYACGQSSPKENQINAEHPRLVEHQSGIDEDIVLAIFDDHHVLPYLPQSTGRHESYDRFYLTPDAQQRRKGKVHGAHVTELAAGACCQGQWRCQLIGLQSDAHVNLTRQLQAQTRWVLTQRSQEGIMTAMYESYTVCAEWALGTHQPRFQHPKARRIAHTFAA